MPSREWNIATIADHQGVNPIIDECVIRRASRMFHNITSDAAFAFTADDYERHERMRRKAHIEARRSLPGQRH